MVITLRCLRCGHEYEGEYEKGVPEERECPECGSNSIRPIVPKEKPTPKEKTE